MKYIRVLKGPYHGQTLQLEDDVAEEAIADEWGADTSAADYDRFNEPPTGLGDAAEYPASLQDYLDSISGVQTERSERREKKPKAHGRAEPAGRLSDDAKTAPKPKPKEEDDNGNGGNDNDKSRSAAKPATTAARPGGAPKPATRR
jgi:hypothetical protein